MIRTHRPTIESVRHVCRLMADAGQEIEPAETVEKTARHRLSWARRVFRAERRRPAPSRAHYRKFLIDSAHSAANGIRFARILATLDEIAAARAKSASAVALYEVRRLAYRAGDNRGPT